MLATAGHEATQGEGQRSWEGQESAGDQALEMTPSSWPQMLLQMILQNDTCHCFCNASVLALMWTIISRPAFALTDLGDFGHQLASAFHASPKEPIQLVDIPWFSNLMATWPLTGQCDAGEFTTYMMGCMHLPFCRPQWARRVQVDDALKTEDAHRICSLVLLKHDIQVTKPDKLDLQSMISAWSQVDGMLAGLTQDTEMLGFLISRGVHSHGIGHKLDFELVCADTVLIPVIANNLQVHWKPFQARALIAHFGEPSHGHYRAALWHQQDLEAAWYLTNDNGTAECIGTHIPRWFAQHAMVAWLINPQHSTVVTDILTTMDAMHAPM